MATFVPSLDEVSAFLSGSSPNLKKNASFRVGGDTYLAAAPKGRVAVAWEHTPPALAAAEAKHAATLRVAFVRLAVGGGLVTAPQPECGQYVSHDEEGRSRQPSARGTGSPQFTLASGAAIPMEGSAAPPRTESPRRQTIFRRRSVSPKRAAVLSESVGATYYVEGSYEGASDAPDVLLGRSYWGVGKSAGRWAAFVPTEVALVRGAPVHCPQPPTCCESLAAAAIPSASSKAPRSPSPQSTRGTKAGGRRSQSPPATRRASVAFGGLRALAGTVELPHERAPAVAALPLVEPTVVRHDAPLKAPRVCGLSNIAPPPPPTSLPPGRPVLGRKAQSPPPPIKTDIPDDAGLLVAHFLSQPLTVSAGLYAQRVAAHFHERIAAVLAATAPGVVPTPHLYASAPLLVAAAWRALLCDNNPVPLVLRNFDMPPTWPTPLSSSTAHRLAEADESELQGLVANPLRFPEALLESGDAGVRGQLEVQRALLGALAACLFTLVVGDESGVYVVTPGRCVEAAVAPREVPAADLLMPPAGSRPRRGSAGRKKRGPAASIAAPLKEAPQPVALTEQATFVPEASVRDLLLFSAPPRNSWGGFAPSPTGWLPGSFGGCPTRFVMGADGRVSFEPSAGGEGPNTRRPDAAVADAAWRAASSPAVAAASFRYCTKATLPTGASRGALRGRGALQHWTLDPSAADAAPSLCDGSEDPTTALSAALERCSVGGDVAVGVSLRTLEWCTTAAYSPSLVTLVMEAGDAHPPALVRRSSRRASRVDTPPPM